MNNLSGYQPYPQNNSNQPAQTSPGPYFSQNGWEYTNGAWRPTQPGAAPQNEPGPGRPKKGGKRVMGVAALVLACSLAGFGGSYAANTLAWNNGKTVLYKSAPAAPTASPTASGESSVSEIAATAGQSVVSIVTENMVSDFITGGQVVSGAGSGVIISQDGYIITNNHVVEGAQSVAVTLPNGDEHDAMVVGTDPATDIAVVKIDVKGLVPAVMGDSDTLQVGEFCLAIGNPMGTLGGTVTDGIVSALNREITIDSHTMSLLQMSAAVSPGNSGGGLFNARGQLVGVVNAKSGGSDTEGLGFAIPVNTAAQVAAQLIENGYVTGRPALGVSVLGIEDEQQAAEAGVAGPGVYIAGVNSGSPAEKAGIQVGDQVVAVDGAPVQQSADLGNAIKEKEVGDSITLSLLRNGTPVEITATLGEMTPST